jgi:hypothetical protein
MTHIRACQNVANDKGEEGFEVRARYLTGAQILDVTTRRYYPDGRDYQWQMERYGPITVLEAESVVTAALWGLAEQRLPF